MISPLLTAKNTKTVLARYQLPVRSNFKAEMALKTCKNSWHPGMDLILICDEYLVATILVGVPSQSGRSYSCAVTLGP